MKYISWLEGSNVRLERSNDEAMIATPQSCTTFAKTRHLLAFLDPLTRRPCNEPTIAESHAVFFKFECFPFLSTSHLSFRVVWNNDDRFGCHRRSRNHPSVRDTMLNRSKRAMMINHRSYLRASVVLEKRNTRCIII